MGVGAGRRGSGWGVGAVLGATARVGSARGVSGGARPSLPPRSSQPQAPCAPEPGRKPLPPSRRLASEPAAEAPGRLSPQVTPQVAPSRMTPLPLWDPGHQAKAGPQLVGAGCGPGVSLSGRTLCHPSWPMYDDWGRVPPTPGQPEEEQAAARDAGTSLRSTARWGSRIEGSGGGRARALSSAGLPVTNHEDVFLLDPLLPRGHRVPLCLPKPPQQAVGSRRLLLPAPIMAPSVHPSSAQACPSTWLSEAEMIALAGLLQMSQGEQTPSSLAGALPSAGCPDPVSVSVSEDPGPSGGQSCPSSADP